MVESKVKLSRTDLALLSHQYDIRVNAAIEEPQASLPPHLYDKWTLGTTFFHILFSYSLTLSFSPFSICLIHTVSHYLSFIFTTLALLSSLAATWSYTDMTERLKRRKTYKSLSQEFSSWKIDLTEVDVKERQNAVSYCRTHFFLFLFFPSPSLPALAVL